MPKQLAKFKSRFGKPRRLFSSLAQRLHDAEALIVQFRQIESIQYQRGNNPCTTRNSSIVQGGLAAMGWPLAVTWLMADRDQFTLPSNGNPFTTFTVSKLTVMT